MKRVCRSREKVAKNSKKFLLNAIVDIYCCNVETKSCIFPVCIRPYRRNLTLFACQQQKSSFVVCKLFFAVFFYIQQTFRPNVDRPSCPSPIIYIACSLHSTGCNGKYCNVKSNLRHSIM